MTDTAPTSGAPDDPASSGGVGEGKAAGACPSSHVVSVLSISHPIFCAAEWRLQAPHSGGHTDDMTGHDTETDGSTDGDVEQRSLAAFGADGTDVEDDDVGGDLAARVEQAETDIDALREVLERTIDQLNDLSDSMTGHIDSDTEGEASSNYDPAPEPADGLRGYE